MPSSTIAGELNGFDVKIEGVQKISIKAEKLTKAYDRQPVVDGISFKVFSGEVFGLLGPNGAGKTTTLEMMEALRPIDAGKVTLEGLDVRRKPYAIKRIIGVLPQQAGFFEFLTLRELLAMFAGLYNQPSRADELLADVQLEEKAKSYVKRLSGGQQQRFSVALALVNRPKILFLDEPTTGLDPQARRYMWELIERIRRSGITIVLTTHYMEEAELLCDRLAIMDAGKIIAMDSPEKLVAKLLKKGFKKKTVRAEATLEDVFIDLTGKSLRE